MSLIGVRSFERIDGLVVLLEVRMAQPGVVPELPVVATLTSSRRLLLALGFLAGLAPAWTSNFWRNSLVDFHTGARSSALKERACS